MSNKNNTFIDLTKQKIKEWGSRIAIDIPDKTNSNIKNRFKRKSIQKYQVGLISWVTCFGCFIQYLLYDIREFLTQQPNENTQKLFKTHSF